LLHLIQYNVFRGLYLNKILLGSATVLWKPGIEPEAFDKNFPDFSVVLPFAAGLPDTLDPSESQMKLIHSTWINLIPFVHMRENLIQWETLFYHLEFPPGSSVAKPGRAKISALSRGECEDDITADRTGLILWGEPYDVNSWEATPGVVRKWAWAMQGCDDLIVSTNRWRRLRDEESLLFSVL
ncbi:hypothetical protein N7462_010844, partial [Penicillium macrosclerotiorum]|uniref:uncharacterized protein n=1 Tax=Penicillium macrosclerotiorum TaxID=303699 RepID=UPI0025495B28